MASQRAFTTNGVNYILGLARIMLGFMLSWAFVDKLFGLGYSTCRDAVTNKVAVLCSQAWLKGGSPTKGFLAHATGPLAGLYHAWAGNPFIDFLFMTGLALIGIALLFGIAVRLAVLAGALLFAMMWAAALPPAQNPLIDEHIIYILVLFAVAATNNNQRLGLAKWWRGTHFVKLASWLA